MWQPRDAHAVSTQEHARGDAGVVSEPVPSGRRRRRRAPVPCRRDLHVRLTDEEFELVAAAAAAERRAVAAWVGATVVRAASSGRVFRPNGAGYCRS